MLTTERWIVDLNEGDPWVLPEGHILLDIEYPPGPADLHPWERLVEVTHGTVAEVLEAVSDAAPLTHHLELAA
jgi:hypothetical protein